MEALVFTSIQNENGMYLNFKNHVGKQWSIPCSNMKTGLEVYQPSNLKGKLLKKFLPLVNRLCFTKALLQGNCTWLNFSPELLSLLNQYFGKDWQCSVYWGTPNIDQKVTLQIYRERVILGYCKIGNSKRVRDLFWHEKDILDYLEQKKVHHVSRCLVIQHLSGYYWAFIQTTEKKPGVKVENSFRTIQGIFLEDLFVKTKSKQLFEQTDYYESLCFLEKHLGMLSIKYSKNVSMTLKKVQDKFQGQVVEWGVSHRDFTPWNNCIVFKKLFVFDFEYALFHAPKEIDFWHFFVQTKHFIEKKSMRQIARSFRGSASEIDTFQLYLLDIISLYLQRGCIDDIEIANQRAELLLYITFN